MQIYTWGIWRNCVRLRENLKKVVIEDKEPCPAVNQLRRRGHIYGIPSRGEIARLLNHSINHTFIEHKP